MNTKIEQKREEIEEMKEGIDFFGYCIETLNPDIIWELERDEIKTLKNTIPPEIVEQIKEQGIPLFYSKICQFYPFLEGEAVDFIDFLKKYKEKMERWYKDELDAFENYEEAETIYKIYHELFDMEEEEIASWYDNEFDTLSWREVYLSKANNVVFLRDEGGYGDDIIIMDPEWDINEIIEKLKEGEPLRKILQ